MNPTKEQILNMIRLGEDSGVEFKEVRFKGDRVSAPGKNHLAKEIAAMANAKGGWLILGVEDKTRRISGVPLEMLDSLERYIGEICAETLKPPLPIDFPQFGERAVFEAIVNAVAHRDYSVEHSKIRFFIFDDRLEIYSPGSLVNSMSVESLALRTATRNERITNLLAECPVPENYDKLGRSSMMERRGDGVDIIMSESEKLSGKAPEYRILDDAEVMLTIFAAKLPNQDEVENDDPGEV